MDQDTESMSLWYPTHENTSQLGYLDAIPDLNYLLSASSYPIPEPPTSQSLANEGQSVFHNPYGGFVVEDTANEWHMGRVSPLSPPRPVGQDMSKPHASESTSTTAPPPRKRGRPRKTEGYLMDQRPEERRRLQIRLAQRAYRSRKETTLSKQEARIAELERTIQQMNSAVLSFSAHVAHTEALASNSDLQSHLRYTLETCNSLTSKQGILHSTALSSGKHSSYLPASREQDLPSSYAFRRRDASPRADAIPDLTLAPTGFSSPLSSGSPLLFNTEDVIVVEISQFVHQLRVACIYNSYFLLRDPSLKLDHLRRKFRFLLRTLDRGSLISYFDSILQAMVNPKRLAEWKDIPFFSVGGAGTHYPQSPLSSSSDDDPPPRYKEEIPVERVPIAELFPGKEILGEASGEWFDVWDVEGFLQEKGIHLLTNPLSGRKGRAVQKNSINASILISSKQPQNLVDEAFSLFHSASMLVHLSRSLAWVVAI
ncbi:hypothetical protein F5884DRAFT_857086 [Xylogone sp. PMI_703]|nr:hypothetical protein F5884DRAFT_857086 [Xylogone sp. PMI_703]